MNYTTATNTTTGKTYTFECDVEAFATYLADTQYIEARYSDTEVICRDVNGNLDTFTISPAA